MDSVIARKEGDTLVMRPARKSWLTFPDDAPLADDDFMAERPDLMQLGRVKF